jgi:NADH:ubiquinone oxidoreductase subunit 5 (subunit L)/multisubunit Na+/H+ antiporter MnhA subunit
LRRVKSCSSLDPHVQPTPTALFALLAFLFLGAAAVPLVYRVLVGASDTEELLAHSTASHLGLIVAGFGIANVYCAKPVKKKPLNRFGRELYHMLISETPVRTREPSPRGVSID